MAQLNFGDATPALVTCADPVAAGHRTSYLQCSGPCGPFHVVVDHCGSTTNESEAYLTSGLANSRSLVVTVRFRHSDGSGHCPGCAQTALTVAGGVEVHVWEPIRAGVAVTPDAREVIPAEAAVPRERSAAAMGIETVRGSASCPV
jgi:hypothetical protein